MKSLIISFLSIFIFAACAQQEDPKIQKQRDLGAIVDDLSQTDIDHLEQLGYKVKKITSPLNIHLVKGITKEELANILPEKNMVQNFEFKNPEDKSFEDLRASALAALKEGTTDKAAPNAPKEKITCKANVKNPLAVLKPRDIKYNSVIKIDLGKTQELKLSALNSLNADEVYEKYRPYIISFRFDGQVLDNSLLIEQQRDLIEASTANPQLNYYWMIQSPVFRSEPYSSPSVKYTFPGVGKYSIMLLVQDKTTGGCAVDFLDVHVTDNPKLNPLVAIPQLREGAEKHFLHLNKTNFKETRKLTQGEGVVIAILDSGVNYNHPSIRPNILINEKEIPDNGIDDDNNGYIDDYIGYDYANQDGYAFDDEGHGSHVAGIAAGADIGIAPKAKILPIKWAYSFASMLDGIGYAILRGADVLNMSISSQGRYYRPEARKYAEKIIKAANDYGLTITVASGNSSNLVSQNAGIPQMIDSPNKLLVSSLNENEKLASYSNYGENVDISTYGGEETQLIYSASIYKGIPYIGMMGTSMASPLAAGAVALAKSLRPDLSPKELIAAIKNTGKENPNIARIAGKELDILNLVNTLKVDLAQR